MSVLCIFGMILQVLRKRLQVVMCRLASDVKDRGAARETEDAINELQRQMGEFERSVSEHQKTLDMTCRLQRAMEEVIIFYIIYVIGLCGRTITLQITCSSTLSSVEDIYELEYLPPPAYS